MTMIKRHGTTLLSSVLYGCLKLYFSLREEHRLRMSKNRVRRRLFGPKRVPRGWTQLHIEKIWHLCFSSNIIRMTS